MSVCRKLPDGTIQKIAGHTILLDANASEVREGTWSMPTSSSTSFLMCNVTFTDPMPDDDYVVVIEADDITSYQQLTQLMVRSKTTTGFEMRVVVADATFGIMTGRYTAFKPVKIEGYTELQNKVNSPDEVPTENSENLVKSGGVWEAIKNASAVWKGTKAEWNALPAAEKQTYDLAVLLDETLVKAVDREDGTETDVANLNKIVHLTKAEYDAMPSHDPDTYYMITDDTTTASSGYTKPDWANAIAITNAQLLAGYTVPADGMAVGFFLAATDGNTVMSVNNIPIAIARGFTPAASDGNIQVPVNKYDTIQISPSINPITQVNFVPWK